MHINSETARQEAEARRIQQTHGALADAQNRLRASPNDPAAQLAFAVALVRNRDIPGAAAQLQALEPVAAHSPHFSEAVSGLYQEIGYQDRALIMARRTLQLAPDWSPALLRLGYLYVQLGWQKQGHALFLRAASRAPASPEPQIALALSYTGTGNLAKAEQNLRAARRLRPADPQTLLLLTQNLAAQRRYDEAEGLLHEALRLAPARADLVAEQARMLWQQARQKPENGRLNGEAARSAAQRALALDPDNAAAHSLLGDIALSAGQEAEALREWERAYALAPDFPRLRLTFGRLLVRQGQADRGRRMLAETAEEEAKTDEYDRLVLGAGLNSGAVDGHRRLARWCRDHERATRALIEWREVLVRLPGDPEAQRGLAAAQTQRERQERKHQ